MKTIGLKTIADRRTDMFYLSPDKIHRKEGWNVRVDTPELSTHIRTLADSIKEVGVLQPLTVYMEGEHAFLSDGFCRLAAVELAISEGVDIKTVPVRAEERTADDAMRTLSMLTRNSGKPLTIPEQAEVVRRLVAYGWSETEISKKTGYSRQHIINLIDYLASAPEVKQLVERGEVAPTTAIKTVKKHGKKAGEVLKDAVAKAKKSGKTRASAKHIERNDRKDNSNEQHLLWIYDRLIRVHKEPENVDYMIRFRKIIESM